MTPDPAPEISELRRHAARLGLPLAQAPVVLPESPLTCFGHALPAAFAWFCRHCPAHDGFPYHDWQAKRRSPRHRRPRRRQPDPRPAREFPPWPIGLLSPFGDPSPLQSRNAWLRAEHPDWPPKWVSFFHGGDGDYCFSFEPDGVAWVAYWHYNCGEQFAPHPFEDHYDSVGFVDWFGGQADAVLARTP